MTVAALKMSKVIHSKHMVHVWIILQDEAMFLCTHCTQKCEKIYIFISTFYHLYFRFRMYVSQ